MKRTKHSLSHYLLSTFDMGQLVPVGHFEVLPGDSIRMSTSSLLRVSPLLTPVMHPVQVRIHHWFVPFRVLWPEWEDFITGADPEAELPLMGPTTNALSLADYFGLPPGGMASQEVVAWPWMAYNLIWNEFYRDQDLQTPVDNDPTTAINNGVLNVAWEKDYFTAARPWTQKGPEVTLPLGGTAPVQPSSGLPPTFLLGTSTPQALAYANAQQGVDWEGPTPGSSGSATWADPRLEADLSAATAVGVNDVRLAFALQRYQEARAQYGSRYTEYLRYLGVRSSDARLQRPEYLGGGKSTIAFSEVLRTGNSDDEVTEGVVGEMKGHGISAVRTRRWVRFFEEHGIVMALASIRPRSMYESGTARSWHRKTKEDYWQRELEQIGQQEVYRKEVYAQGGSLDTVFGYQDRYAEYRHHQSYVTGEFRDVLNDWHLARIFGSAPALNSDFVTCVPSKRIHAAQENNTIWSMFSHSIQARRMVGKRTIGRIF
ncbi:major capsid protein [Dragonfly-associated microphage 1]|uniref:major capsid protein n=1 Tax=Dragonfly-associated microphage 1 TaxID=1234888 RepID=UPI00028ACF79|nr:major capsid protein [Dragonfly-associated microphage 1]AFS65318.1 major capsid protein [Dragonfly-associated microphage 1]